MPNEVTELFENKLKLKSLPGAVQISFWNAITKYLQHGRKEGVIEGRTLEYLEKHLDELLKFLDALMYTDEEKVIIITRMPAILNTTKDVIDKFLLLGVIENQENTFRRKKLLNKTNDYRVGIKKIYGRYITAITAGYHNINWNLLVHSTDTEFASIFVKNVHEKDYQIFDTHEEVLAFVNNVSLDTLNIEELKNWDVNREIVDNYEGRKSLS